MPRTVISIFSFFLNFLFRLDATNYLKLNWLFAITFRAYVRPIGPTRLKSPSLLWSLLRVIELEELSLNMIFYCVQVIVVDMDRRQSECRSVGDPHIMTFDGRSVSVIYLKYLLLGRQIVVVVVVVVQLQLQLQNLQNYALQQCSQRNHAVPWACPKRWVFSLDRNCRRLLL